MMFAWEVVVGVICVAIAAYILYIKWLRSNYPPGPWPLPVVGNLHLLSRNQHFDFADLAKRYGPVFTIWQGVQPTVIVCNLQLAKDVLVRKGIEFAGRAFDSGGFKILFRKKQNLFNQSFNERVPIIRKIILSMMKYRSSDGMSVKKIAEEEVNALLEMIKRMEGQREDPYYVVNVSICNIITRSLASIRFQSQADPRYLEWTKIRYRRSSLVRKAHLVSCFPFLWYIRPSYRKEMLSSKKFADSFLDIAFREHERTYQEGVIRDFADEVIKFYRGQDEATPSSQRLDQSGAFGILEEIFGAGTETTIASLCWVFLILLRRPDIQHKVHEEIDRYVKEKALQTGNDPVRLTLDLSDRPSLPYLNAVIHETMRRCPVSPLLLPHKTLVDTTLGGYSIPVNTAVVCNVYACHMDDKIWANPSEIIPERFMDSEIQFDFARSKDVLQFGAGPRNCVGENLARMMVFLCVSNILNSFELRCKSVDDLPTLNEVRFTLDCFPQSYKMSFIERKK